MSAAVSLAYTAAMQEHGVPVSGHTIDEDQASNLVDQGRDLLDRVTDLASDQP
jgi:hypothetical protein